MMLTFDSGILCDDIRREDNGKIMLIGCYPSDIVYPNFPAVGVFWLYARCHTKGPGSYNFSFRLYVGSAQPIEVGGNVVVGGTDGVAWLPLNFPPVSLPGETNLRVCYVDEQGQDHRIVDLRVTKGAIGVAQGIPA